LRRDKPTLHRFSSGELCLDQAGRIADLQPRTGIRHPQVEKKRLHLNRREFLETTLGGLAALLIVPACSEGKEDKVVGATGRGNIARLEKPRSEWKKILPADRYAVLFEEHTEPPFSSPLNKEKRAGTFICGACFLPLFSSTAKFDSGTGWPSFYEPLTGHVDTRRDFRLIIPRTEYHCTRCGGHQGHVFKDGPPPTGQRWCNNGLALEFVVDGKPLPALRS
jgi:peptide-methionine (R)-S-oxide reductase